ncbi:MAG: hypothetical protein ACOCVZ_07230 [Gemmatimonadota bacterium]
MTQDRKEQRMLELARTYNEPPEPPREEMWAAIREALPRTDPGGESSRGRLDLDARRARRRLDGVRRWAPWALGLAAAASLAVGFGLGRITQSPDAAAPPAVAADGETSLPMRLAAAEHLGEAEAMLTLFRSADRSEDRAATAAWARDLLGTTRMLIDSRASQDPEMARLLADLELVLVQIAMAAESPTEHELIEDGIEERQLLTKLRSTLPPVDAAL